MFNKDARCTLSRAEIEQKANEILKQMTLKEKVWMLNGNWNMVTNQIRYKNAYNPTPIATNGVKRLGVSPIKFTDGPRGVVMGKSTCFPVSMARGASFDRALEKRIGDAIGKEARAQGANFFGGVCVNLLRHPAWGRAQETYGEDPFLVGEMGKHLAEGVQEHNVMACVKHYAFNNIENSRFFVDVQADDRTMHEVYLAHFKKIVQAGAASVMGAYNRFRGDQACESRLLLTEILREDWGFEGFTISDFIFGVRNGKKAIEAGLDVEMPLPIHYQRNLLKAVQNGEVAESVVDQAALRVLRTLLVFENTPDPMTYPKSLVASPEHIALAREAAEKSMVLIKNEGAALPFDRNVKRVLVLGKLAAQENTGDHGSSRVYAPYVITALEGLRKYLGAGVEILHRDETQLAEARQLAGEVDCVIIVAGNDFNDEGEYVSPGGMQEMLKPVIAGYRNMGKPLGAFLLKLMAKSSAAGSQSPVGLAPGGDRQNLSLKPEQAALIQAVAGINPRTVVCLVCGSMIMIDEWAENVPAILYSWYSGMEGGTALARLLFGDVNPSGKLPFTIPTSVEHLPYFSSTDPTITYDLYHGYTLLDHKGLKPAYPFGFGLSYTTYAYRNARVARNGQNLQVTVEVSNTGARDGEEIVQVYVGMEKSAVERQKKLLKGFEKVAIPAGGTATVKIEIPLDELRYYDAQAKQWRLEPGVYRVMVGPSSDDATLLKTSIEITAA
ncbi:MAG TPA: glycoside hydrolase family 3 C-terminal domain-containing protein [Anaerolineae bacterium]|nr:glycoside hydrolase family 3 C-terminal domain-containing protein [Anaerolineae bacterium]HQK15549.1 glycoside hydrolase family 3 C-terminal domain-containing protein [Anaerolineae bacterium]